MNYSAAIFLINKNVRAVKCRYLPDDHNPTTRDPNNASIFKTLDQSVKPDDFVVVPTTTRHGMTVVKVTEVDVMPDLDAVGTDYKWIVQRVDSDAYDSLLKKEADAIAKIRSAEMRRKREDMAAALFKDHEETLKSIALATTDDSSDETPGGG